MRCPTLIELPSSPPGRIGWPWTEENPQLPDTMTCGHPWPRITIVTPSRNQAPYIEETIRSVLLQGYPNLEYIIMDGGSTDGSAGIICRYVPWLSYVRIGPDEGQGAAIAEGFQRGTGEIRAWLNSDDRYRAETLARVARFFAAHPNVVLANGDVNYIDAAGNLIQRIFAIPPNRFLTINLGAHGWPQQGCFWRAWAYEGVGGIDRSLQFCMDRDLFIRLTGIGCSRRIPGKPLADFRVHDQAKSSTMVDIAGKESAQLLNKYGNPTVRSAKRLLRLLWWLWCKPTSLRVRLNRICRWE